MLASLYPIMDSVPHTGGSVAWLALVITGAVLVAVVLFAWAAARSARRHPQAELRIEGQPTAKAA